MVDNGHVSGDKLVLEDRSIGQIDPGAFIGNDDDGPAKGDVTPKPDVAGNGKVVQLQDVGNRAEAFLEIRELLEGIPKLDHRHRGKHALRVHHKLSVLERVQVAGDEE